METSEFRKAAHQLVDWMADYMEGTQQYPVKPAMRPGDIKKQLPAAAPEKPESFDQVFKDFNEIVMPGMTHWQHPRFFAYFPTGASAPSVLAEMLSATLGAQCMIWLTSPAAEGKARQDGCWFSSRLHGWRPLRGSCSVR
jgi:aromatic-L-amino-acid decarboxylase